MTSSFSDAAGPVIGADGHAGEDLLASYAAGTAGMVAAWSAAAHLTGCVRCRSALSAHVDAERLARNRSVLLVRAALPEGGRARRLLGRCGVPDHVLRLLVSRGLYGSRPGMGRLAPIRRSGAPITEGR